MASNGRRFSRGVGFGGAAGLWFGSCGIFEEAKLILQYDEELMVKAGGSVVEEEVMGGGDGSA